MDVFISSLLVIERKHLVWDQIAIYKLSEVIYIII